MGILSDRIDRARKAVLKQAPEARADLGIILGSGLGGLIDTLNAEHRIALSDIAGMPASTAPGHAGALHLGALAGKRTAILQGRVHLYEGYSAQEVALPVYLLAALGVRTLIITNAAGALNPDYAPGDMAIIRDHLNFTGQNPLTGLDEPSIGVRFPDMSQAYDPALAARADAVSRQIGIEPRTGVYAGVAGPSLETSAERRFFRLAGADLVGMSTVLETIAANHAGLSVLGLSAVTNKATGGDDQAPDTLESVLHYAGIAGDRIKQLIVSLAETLDD